MNRYQHPQDEKIARQLANLGKARDCICEVKIEEIPGMRVDVSLDCDIGCSVHFPLTSTLTTGDAEHSLLWLPEPVSADSVVSEMVRAERLNTD